MLFPKIHLLKKLIGRPQPVLFCLQLQYQYQSSVFVSAIGQNKIDTLWTVF